MSCWSFLAGYVVIYEDKYLHSTFTVLGAYLTTSAAQTADVECFAADGQTLLSDQMSDCKCLFLLVRGHA